MVLDHGHRHDVEDPSGVGVLEIRKFLVASSLVAGGLNLAVHLPAISPFEEDAVISVGGEKGPELVFGDTVFSVRNVGLFAHAVLVLADEKVLDVFLKGQFRGFLLPRHGQSSSAVSLFDLVGR